MTTAVEATTPYAQALLASVTINVLVPLVMFVIMLAFIFWVLWRAQTSQDNAFQIEHMLLGDDNRVSIWRFLSLLAFCVSTWYLAAVLFRQGNDADWQLYLIYVATWAGTPAMMKFAEKWNGNVPFSHPPSGPPQQ